jgi:hypothetical protein
MLESEIRLEMDTDRETVEQVDYLLNELFDDNHAYGSNLQEISINEVDTLEQEVFGWEARKIFC